MESGTDFPGSFLRPAPEGPAAAPEKSKAEKKKKSKAETAPSAAKEPEHKPVKAPLHELLKPVPKHEARPGPEAEPEHKQDETQLEQTSGLAPAEERAKRLREQAEINAHIQATESDEPAEAEEPVTRSIEELAQGITIELRGNDADVMAEFVEIDLAPAAAEQEDELPDLATAESEPAEDAVEAEQVRPLEVAAGGGGGNSEPPRSERNIATPEPEPEPELLRIVYEQTLPPAVRAAMLANQPETLIANVNPNVPSRPPDVEFAAMAARAERRGESRGLLVGLFVGGAIEHFRHKHKAREQAKRVRKESAAQNQHINRLESEQQVERSRAAAVREQFERFRQRTQTELSSLRSRSVEKLPARLRPEQSVQKPEKLLRRQSPERVPATVQPETEEPLMPPPGRRVEVSAWHRIEIDTATGKTVENPTFEYGREFHREQQRESLGQLLAVAVTGTVFALGSVASTHRLPAGNQSAPLAQSAPKSATDNSNFAAQRQLARQALATTPAWLWALLLVVIIAIIASVAAR